MDTQVIELIGRNRLTNELLRAGMEVALPLRDRGVDLIAYVDLKRQSRRFVARPIQMKASSYSGFGINCKYEKISDLLIAFVWGLATPGDEATYAMSYADALSIAGEMGYTKTHSWQTGSYSTTNPSKKLRKLLEPYKMTTEKWRHTIAQDR